MGFEERAGLKQAGVCQRLGAHQGAGSERKAAAGIIRLERDQGRKREGLGAELEIVARREGQPFGQNRGHDGTGACQRRIQRHRRLERDRADQRIGAVDGFHLGQGAFGAVVTVDHHHRAEIGDLGYLRGAILHPGAFLGRGKAVGEAQLGVTAEKLGAFLLQPQRDRGAHHADAGNRGDTQRQAGEKDAEAAQASAQFAPGKAGGRGEAHSAASRACASIRPSRSRTTRSQRAASEGA